MNAALKFAVGLGLAFALSACSQDTPEKKVDDLNSMIGRLNAISSTLQTEGLPLQSTSSRLFREREVPSGLSDNKVTYLRGLLNEFVSLGEQVLAGSKDKDVFFTDSAKLQSQIDSAKAYLRQLQGYEQRGAQERQAEQRRHQERRDRQSRQLETLRQALVEVSEMKRDQADIKRGFGLDVSEILRADTLPAYGRMETRRLEELRRQTRAALARCEKARSLLRSVDEGLLETPATKRDLERSLAAHGVAMELHISQIGRELTRRTGETRPEMDRARPRDTKKTP